MGLYKEEGGCMIPPLSHGRTIGNDVMYFYVCITDKREIKGWHRMNILLHNYIHAFSNNLNKSPCKTFLQSPMLCMDVKNMN